MTPGILLVDVLLSGSAGATSALSSAGAYLPGWMSLLAAAAPTGGGEAAVELPVSEFTPVLQAMVYVGFATLILGMCLSLLRMLRGPHLADRVLSADTLAMHVVGFVIMLSIAERTTIYFDAVLVVAIIGFASTLAFAQYIGCTDDKHRPENPFNSGAVRDAAVAASWRKQGDGEDAEPESSKEKAV